MHRGGNGQEGGGGKQCVPNCACLCQINTDREGSAIRASNPPPSFQCGCHSSIAGIECPLPSYMVTSPIVHIIMLEQLKLNVY